jgi:hypothetical protein
LAVVATIVALYEHAKNYTAATETFNQAIAYWSEQKVVRIHLFTTHGFMSILR